jgi:hypothetical protein
MLLLTVDFLLNRFACHGAISCNYLHVKREKGILMAAARRRPVLERLSFVLLVDAAATVLARLPPYYWVRAMVVRYISIGR